MVKKFVVKLVVEEVDEENQAKVLGKPRVVGTYGSAKVAHGVVDAIAE